MATCPPFFDARVGEELRFARFIGIGIAAGNLLDANASSTTFTSAMKDQIETATSDNTVIVASTLQYSIRFATPVHCRSGNA